MIATYMAANQLTVVGIRKLLFYLDMRFVRLSNWEVTKYGKSFCR